MKKQNKNLPQRSRSIGLIPLGDRVLIREKTEKAERTDSGIYLPESAKEDKGSKRGEAVAIGAGRYEDGERIPMTVSVGDTVLFQWGDQVKIDGEEYFIVRESEIIAIIK